MAQQTRPVADADPLQARAAQGHGQGVGDVVGVMVMQSFHASWVTAAGSLFHTRRRAGSFRCAHGKNYKPPTMSQRLGSVLTQSLV
jgi:hypothetical protein